MHEHMHVYLYNVVFDCISFIQTFHLSEKLFVAFDQWVRITEDSLY